VPPVSREEEVALHNGGFVFTPPIACRAFHLRAHRHFIDKQRFIRRRAMPRILYLFSPLPLLPQRDIWRIAKRARHHQRMACWREC